MGDRIISIFKTQGITKNGKAIMNEKDIIIEVKHVCKSYKRKGEIEKINVFHKQINPDEVEMPNYYIRST